MNYKLLADTALLAGEIMLKSGAETYRVEETINRILSIPNLERVESFVAGTGIIATIDDSSIDAITLIKRVDYRIVNLYRISKVNDISRKLCQRELELKEAYDKLVEVNQENLYKSRTTAICTVATAAFFCALLGGNILDCICAAFHGMLSVVLAFFMKKSSLKPFIINMTISFFIAISAMIYCTILKDKVSQDMIIIGSIMPLLPGVAFTNAIRDTLHGDYMSGVSRAMEAIVVGLALSVGIGIGLTIFSYIKVWLGL